MGDPSVVYPVIAIMVVLVIMIIVIAKGKW